MGVTASTILGWDFHTPENILADIDAFVSLEPLFYQVTPLIPCPGTQLYRRLQEDGRFLPGQDWSFKQYQDDEVMQRKNFAQGELRRFYDLALKKLYEENGPSQIRAGQGGSQRVSQVQGLRRALPARPGQGQRGQRQDAAPLPPRLRGARPERDGWRRRPATSKLAARSSSAR